MPCFPCAQNKKSQACQLDINCKEKHKQLYWVATAMTYFKSSVVTCAQLTNSCNVRRAEAIPHIMYWHKFPKRKRGVSNVEIRNGIKFRSVRLPLVRLTIQCSLLKIPKDPQPSICHKREKTCCSRMPVHAQPSLQEGQCLCIAVSMLHWCVLICLFVFIPQCVSSTR